MRWRRLGVLAALVAVVGVAVLAWVRAGQGRVTEVDEARVLVAERTRSAMHAFSSGELAMVGGCLGIVDNVVIWPNGTHVVDEEPLRIEVPGLGEYGVGDVIETGGGWVSEPSSAQAAPESLVARGVPVPEECAAHPVFVMAPED